MTKAVLMMLLGLLCNEVTWASQIAALPQLQCVVPSYGGRDSIAAMARSVLAAAPSERFPLAGHSMGGRVALEVMRVAPHRVERIALLDTGIDPIPDGDAGERERSQRFELLGIARAHGMRATGQQWARGMVHPAQLDTPLLGQILAMIDCSTPDMFEAQIRALIARPDARDVFRGITCKALLLCGRQDAWSPLSRHEEMHALMPHAHLAVIEDAGHFAMMEQPDAVSRAFAQ